MRRLLFLLLAGLILLPNLAAAGPVADNSPIARLRSVEAQFTQEKHLQILTRPLISHGIFAFQAPQSLRWEYRTPLRSVILMHDGRIEKMIERNGRLEHENTDGVNSMQIILQEIGNWLDGRFTDNPMFNVTRDDKLTINLTPKEKGLASVISRIELRLGQQAAVMESVTIFEGPDAWTKLTFANPIVNRDIPADFFLQP